VKCLRWLWKWSLFWTLPVSVLFVFWATGAVDRWYQFEVKVSTSDELDLWRVGKLEAQHMLRSAGAKAKALQIKNQVADSGLRTINIYLEESDWDGLNSDLPDSGREYVKGAMYYDGQYRKVQLRYRGDNVYHWGYWKKSWRVKTKSAALFDGMRKFNLVAPRTVEVLNNFLALRLAEEMGLIAPKVELVNVLINGHYPWFLYTDGAVG
jgi:spore coat protein CotH